MPKELRGNWTAERLKSIELLSSARELLNQLAVANDKKAVNVVSSLRSSDRAERWGDCQVDGRLLTSVLPFTILNIQCDADRGTGAASIFYDTICGRNGDPIKKHVVIIVQVGCNEFGRVLCCSVLSKTMKSSNQSIHSYSRVRVCLSPSVRASLLVCHETHLGNASDSSRCTSTQSYRCHRISALHCALCWPVPTEVRKRACGDTRERERERERERD